MQLVIRLAWLTLLACFTAQVTGVFEACAETCSETCPDEGPEHECPPACSDCVCGVPLATPAPVHRPPEPEFALVPAAPQVVPAFDPHVPPLPDPREILRVPR